MLRYASLHALCPFVCLNESCGDILFMESIKMWE